MLSDTPYNALKQNQRGYDILLLHDQQGSAFIDIAYDQFYHQKTARLVHALQEKAQTQKEKDAIWDFYFGRTETPKKRYDFLASSLKPPIKK